MIDENGRDDAAGQSEAAGVERVGFCQDCGRALTRETVRTVGSGVFCEPCLETRLGTNATGSYNPGAAGQPAAGPAAGQGTGTGASYVPPPIAVPGEPSPLLAGFLGLIPGVGAMYNGQFAKGIVHLIIFAVLCWLSDNVSGVFGLFVFGWICYQAFEAYHTAKARLEGLPLPNAFGFNDIGERMGFDKNWPGSVTRPSPTPPVTPWTRGTAPVPPPAPPPGGPVSTTPDWVGYVPPSAFATSPQVAPPSVDPSAQASGAASWGSSPYQAPYTAAPYTATPFAAPYTPVATGAAIPPTVAPPVPSRRFPVGALWLIGLGVLFLLANVNSDFRIGGRWLIPLVLAGISIWSFTRRLSWMGGTGRQQGDIHWYGPRISSLRWPVMVMVLAILFFLQAAHSMTLGQTWPVLVIALGALLLLERSSGPAYTGTAAYAAPQSDGFAAGASAANASAAGASGETSDERRAAQWTSSDEPPKGEQ